MSTTLDDPLGYVRTVVGHASYRASVQGRTDLVDRLERHRSALEQLEGATVAVVGLCDSGKSTLVNACAGRAVVPVDLLHPTPVPVVVKAGDGTARIHADDAEGPRDTPVEELPAALATPTPATHLVEIGAPEWPRPASLVLVDTPSYSLGTPAARELLIGLDPDVLVVVSDAGQELGQVELATIVAARRRHTHVVVVLTKVDLHPHWRRILERDQAHLREASVTAPLLAVSVRLYELGRTRQNAALVAESGVAALLDIVDGAATGARQAYLCTRALEAVLDTSTDLTSELQGERTLLTNPEAAERANEHLVKSRADIERLKGAGARWRERLHDGLERLQLETEHELRTRMARLQSDALEEIESIDPTEMWPVFSARLERMVETEVTATFAALEENSTQLAEEVAELFGDEAGIEPADMALGDHARLPEDVRLQGRLEDVDAGRGGSAINALRGSAASLSITAILTRYGVLLVGGALLQAILLPVGAAMTLLLGHHAVKASRDSRTMMRRRAAGMAVRKYLDGVGPEVAVRMRTEFMHIRTELRNYFERTAAGMAARVDTELRAAVDSVRASDDERALRVASLDEELKQIELVAAHARRARTLLSEEGALA